MTCTTHHDACECRQADAAARIAALESELAAAFAMSKCECASDECCANLVAAYKRAESAESELARVREDAERWQEIRSHRLYMSDAGPFIVYFPDEGRHHTDLVCVSEQSADEVVDSSRYSVYRRNRHG